MTPDTPAQLEALLNGPALAPPAGVIPQLEHPPSLQKAANAVPILCLVLTTLAILMRMYTKIRVIHEVLLADCLYT